MSDKQKLISDLKSEINQSKQMQNLTFRGSESDFAAIDYLQQQLELKSSAAVIRLAVRLLYKEVLENSDYFIEKEH